MADTGAVYRVMAAQELHDLGSVEIEEADIVGDWQIPGYDVPACTIGVVDPATDTLVGYAETGRSDRGDAAVLPAYRGRGVGTWLAWWMRESARSRGWARVGMPVPEGGPGDRLLAGLGYGVRWHSWVLSLPAGASIVERPLPPGYVVRAAEPAEWRAVHRVVDEAFLEWSERDPEPYEAFAAGTVDRPGFEPWHLRVVVDPDGAVVGAAYVTVFDGGGSGDPADRDAFINRLAVRPDQRHRGLAQALMVDAFAVARNHGATSSGLSTDSRTGALGLYEKVGMKVTSTWLHRAVALD
ncbi:MAG: GNAT family N-acetyltransferase [Nocardioides sp.]|nr:GNAT family N-acetyltransferase [Nocardioides sp.]